jgi:hypothetical protein
VLVTARKDTVLRRRSEEDQYLLLDSSMETTRSDNSRPKYDLDYTETVRFYFGQKGWVFCTLCFITIFLVANIIFMQLMPQSLYPVILTMTGSRQDVELVVDWSKFSYSWTCVIVLLVNLIAAQ